MEVDTGRIIAVKKLPIAGPVSEQVWDEAEVIFNYIIALAYIIISIERIIFT